jgi:hypothetical protein
MSQQYHLPARTAAFLWTAAAQLPLSSNVFRWTSAYLLHFINLSHDLHRNRQRVLRGSAAMPRLEVFLLSFFYSLLTTHFLLAVRFVPLYFVTLYFF